MQSNSQPHHTCKAIVIEVRGSGSHERVIGACQAVLSADIGECRRDGYTRVGISSIDAAGVAV